MTDVYEAILTNAVNIQWRPGPQQESGWPCIAITTPSRPARSMEGPLSREVNPALRSQRREPRALQRGSAVGWSRPAGRLGWLRAARLLRHREALEGLLALDIVGGGLVEARGRRRLEITHG
jgi:hypothetical protein